MRALCRVIVMIPVSMIVFTTTAARAVPEAQEASGTFRSSVSLVALNVSVQDAESRYVTDLRPSDFAVFDDGIRREVRVFETAKIPIDLVLLLDVSQSMGVRMALARRAARGLIGTLRDGDRGAVLLFNQRVQAMTGLTADRAALTATIDQARAIGDTALHNGVYVALKQFAHVACDDSEVRRQALVVLSDGEDTASSVSFDDVIALARSSGMTIYTVRVQDKAEIEERKIAEAPRRSSEADFDMRSLARETGALSFFPVSEQLPAVYSAIAQELSSQYSIAYEPPAAAGDGRFHRVSVQILNRPDLRTRTRLGYTSLRPSRRGD